MSRLATLSVLRRGDRSRGACAARTAGAGSSRSTCRAGIATIPSASSAASPRRWRTRLAVPVVLVRVAFVVLTLFVFHLGPRGLRGRSGSLLPYAPGDEPPLERFARRRARDAAPVAPGRHAPGRSGRVIHVRPQRDGRRAVGRDPRGSRRARRRRRAGDALPALGAAAVLRSSPGRPAGATSMTSTRTPGCASSRGAHASIRRDGSPPGSSRSRSTAAATGAGARRPGPGRSVPTFPAPAADAVRRPPRRRAPPGRAAGGPAQRGHPALLARLRRGRGGAHPAHPARHREEPAAPRDATARRARPRVAERPDDGLRRRAHRAAASARSTAPDVAAHLATCPRCRGRRAARARASRASLDAIAGAVAPRRRWPASVLARRGAAPGRATRTGCRPRPGRGSPPRSRSRSFRFPLILFVGWHALDAANRLLSTVLPAALSVLSRRHACRRPGAAARRHLRSRSAARRSPAAAPARGHPCLTSSPSAARTAPRRSAPRP